MFVLFHIGSKRGALYHMFAIFYRLYKGCLFHRWGLEMSWVVYILECADRSLYTGITNDLDRRLAQHEAGQGSKYTRGRGPLRLAYSEKCDDRSHASKRELEIKALSRAEKQGLIS